MQRFKSYIIFRMGADIYRDVLYIFYPIFFIFSTITQLMLIYLIFYHSPTHLKMLKVFLLNTSLFQIILVVVSCSSQFRMITTAIPIELRSYGLLRYLEAWLGYTMYQVLQVSFLSVSLEKHIIHLKH